MSVVRQVFFITSGVIKIETGYIKLWRSLIGKAIWKQSTPTQAAIVITLLMMANFTENQWMWKGKKFETKPGQFITSVASIIEKCPKGVTRQNVRTSLIRLFDLGFLTYETTKTGMLITIVNWRVYQGTEELSNQQSNHCLTNSQPTGNQQPNHYIRRKKDKNVENVRNDISSAIINHLNQACGTNYRLGASSTKHIKARIAEGYSFGDFKAVIDKKCKEWLGTEHSKYLRPDTLFGTKFDTYLNQPTSSRASPSGRDFLKDLARGVTSDS